MMRIEHLLRGRIGLDASSVGSSLIQRTVRLRMKSLGLKRLEDYRRLLVASRPEWAELVESVVVTETWFFRDQAVFAALVRLVFEEGLPAHPAGPVRLLSIPCSSGEEPYSAAIALLEAGVPANRFHIDAVDLSARAVARAQRGIYGKNSFRGKGLGFRDRYFQQTREGFVLSKAVRSCVQFHRANLLAEDFPVGREPYDFILCRNLLIYFDRATQQNGLQRIERLLRPSGVLFVGPAEQPFVIGRGFLSANIPMAFACRKAGYAPPGSGASCRRASPRRLPAPAADWPSPPGRRADPDKLALAMPPPDAEADLEHARRLAEAGRLDDAAVICEAHLQKSRASAQAWYLLGRVREAAGDDRALDHYRKALYLEPNHYETLLQMALLAQKRGDLARARTLKRRAERLRSKP